jgi:riboflavin synthase
LFTGLIEEIGIIDQVKQASSGKTLTVLAEEIMSDLRVGDSISVNGVCLTAESLLPNGFTVSAVEETLTRSSLSEIKARTRINLERAMRADSRFGGHFVQGHVDGVARVARIRQTGIAHLLTLDMPEPLLRYVILKGSIAIQGISLTVAEIARTMMTIAVIPHTWMQTTLQDLQPGSLVNIETDMWGKYVEKYMQSRSKSSGLTEEQLKELGY